MHEDIESDLQFIRPLCEALGKLAEIVDGMSERIEKLEKVVMDDIIGGVTNLYNTNRRLKGIEDIRSKYSDMLAPDELDAFKEFYGERDMFGDLFDMIEQMRSGEGYSDEMGDSKIKEVLESFKGKVGKFKPKPAEIAIEVETSSEPEEKPAEDDIAERVRKMKANRPFKY